MVARLTINTPDSRKDEFDIYINERMVKLQNKNCYEVLEINKDRCRIKVIKKHVCDYDNWIVKGLLGFMKDMVSKAGIYSRKGDVIGIFRAVCEGVLILDGDTDLNIKLDRNRIYFASNAEGFLINVSTDNKKSIWKEEMNRLEFPEYLRKRWDIIKIPFLILATILLILFSIILINELKFLVR
ncbi:hypothetical protein [Clostridium sp. YIM B02551]|uniref:hypothetical protein n=1 Tax=Clostridium sp. YIM B02551 TaxID=2910679 RepID=UPI001EEAAB4B|nr:hypothetical protein [Clostridium sp. YIM B02551]